MSFELPRAAISLRFTGEVKALGQQRPKGPPPTSSRSVPALEPPPPKAPKVDVPSVIINEGRASSPSSPAPKLPTLRGSMARAPLASFDDDAQTLALDRGDMPFRVPPKPKPQVASLPVPGFRSAQQARMPGATVKIIQRPNDASTGLSLMGWLCVAFIAAVVSYYFAPTAANGLGQALRVLADR